MSYSASKKGLFFEAFFLCFVIKCVIVGLPFRWVQRLLGLKVYQADRLYEEKKDNAPLVLDIFNTVNAVSRHDFWTNTCLVRSLSIKLMLRRRKIFTVLYMGLAKEETGQLKAHAWLKALDSGLIYDDGRSEFKAVAMLV
jgi:Transglutaminase-like superfamily